MQLMEVITRTRDDVVGESRAMLHSVFDDLEAHEEQIGAEIMDRTVEERTVGPCPVCGKDLQIRQVHGASQFIGCSGYPECTFNISLPGVQWGKAIRLDQVCDKTPPQPYQANHEGCAARDIGCPHCSSYGNPRVQALRLIIVKARLSSR